MQKMRILLTENCNADCDYCFNKDIREKKEMDVSKAKLLFDLLEKNRVKQIKFMGGEPTLHSSFQELFKYAQSKIECVCLFTNAINDEILKIEPRPNDAININMLFINDNFNFNKLLPKYDFGRSFEVVIPSKVDTDLIIYKIKLFINKFKELNIKKRPKFNLTLDCTENIFQYKNKISAKYLTILKFIKNVDEKILNTDHSIPKCFWPKELRDELKGYKITEEGRCEQNCMGLINSSFQIGHCNQLPAFRENIFEMKDGTEQIMDYKKIKRILLSSHMKKISYVLDTHCINCEHSLDTCNGGCMMHKFDKNGNMHVMDEKYFDMFR